MDPTDVTHEILRSIHAEMKGLRQEFSGLREDFSGLREDFGGLREDFGGLREEVGGLRGDVREMSARMRRQVEADTRLSTEIVGVVGVMQDVRDLLRDDLRLRPRLDDHERRITELEKKT
jgi:chromosome segregation ATPase